MNFLTDVNYLKNLFKRYHLKPNERLGQNFLIDQEVLRQIIQIAELTEKDTILEVGPGVGTLTIELAKHASQVITVEKDESLIPLVKLNSQFFTNVKIWESDILKFHLDKQIQGPYKVVANIPYYLTSVLFQFFLQQKNQPKLLVLMVQKEVGERVVAKPGELSILGISVQLFADVEIAAHIPKQSFWPQPQVDSVILTLVPRRKFPEVDDEKLFFKIVKVAFAGKRKQIHNTLFSGLGIEKFQLLDMLERSGIKPTARPQDLSLEQWVDLYQNLVKLGV